jgi:hypothetical protein
MMIWSVIIFVILILLLKRKRSRYYKGPAPTETERNAAENWIVDHIEKYPKTTGILQNFYPEAKIKANAIGQYKRLEQLRADGRIGEKEYQTQLDEISEHIDISDVFAK